MSEELAKRAELLKLARILNTEPQALAFLQPQAADQLRLLREAVSDGLFQKFRPRFAGFARMSSLLPLKISAKVSEQVLGPMLSGRIASEMKPERAIDLAKRLPDAFLADTCLQLDPQRSQAIIAGTPVERVVTLTRILLSRGEYITMGRFVDYMPLAMLQTAAAAIDDDCALLQISFFVEDTTQLTQIISQLPENRRAGVIAAAAEHALWPEAIATIERIDDPARSQLGELALNHDDATVDSLIRAAAEHDLWPALMRLARSLSTQAQQRLAEQSMLADDTVMASVVASVARHENHADFAALLADTPAPRCALVLAAAVAHAPDALSRLAQAADADSAALPALIAGANELDNAARTQLTALCGGTPLAAALEAS